jgi:hypothetical protein
VAWFAVRHFIENDGSFEERITLWDAATADEAISRAELELEDYVSAWGGNVNVKALELLRHGRRAPTERGLAER